MGFSGSGREPDSIGHNADAWPMFATPSMPRSYTGHGQEEPTYLHLPDAAAKGPSTQDRASRPLHPVRDDRSERMQRNVGESHQQSQQQSHHASESQSQQHPTHRAGQIYHREPTHAEPNHAPSQLSATTAKAVSKGPKSSVHASSAVMSDSVSAAATGMQNLHVASSGAGSTGAPSHGAAGGSVKNPYFGLPMDAPPTSQSGAVEKPRWSVPPPPSKEKVSLLSIQDEQEREVKISEIGRAHV